MFKRATAISLGLAVLLSPLMAQAQWAPRYYAGGDFTSWTYSQTGFGNARPAGVRARVGAELHPNFAIGGHLFFGASDQVFGPPVNNVLTLAEMGLDWGASILAEGRMPFPFYERMSLLGMVGFTTARLSTREEFVGSRTDSENGLGFGFGVEFAASDNVSLNVDWIQYLDESYALRGLNFGLRYRW